MGGEAGVRRRRWKEEQAMGKGETSRAILHLTCVSHDVEASPT